MDKNTKSGWDAISRENMGETNDCSVVAVALATDLPYETVHAAMKANGRKYRKGTYQDTTLNALLSLGFDWVKIDPKQITVDFPGRHKGLQNLTVKHWERFEDCLEWTKGRKFLLSTGRHMLAIVDGKVQDWTEGRSFRVKWMWEVITKEQKENFDLGERLLGNWPRFWDETEMSPELRRRWARNLLTERLVVMRGLYMGKDMDKEETGVSWRPLSELEMEEWRERICEYGDESLFELSRQSARDYCYMVIMNMVSEDGAIFSDDLVKVLGFTPINMDGVGWDHHYSWRN